MATDAVVVAQVVEEEGSTPPSRLDPRFAINLDVEASPGGQGLGRVRAHVEALVDSDAVHVTVTAPDLDALARGRAGAQTLPVGTPVRSIEEWSGSLSAGEAVELDGAVAIPRPGYYRFVVSARQAEDGGSAAIGTRIKSAGHTEAWLWIGTDRVETAPAFDTDVFPPEIEPVPGPHRPRLGTTDFHRPTRPGDPTPSRPDVAHFQAVYYDLNVGSWRPVPHTELRLEYWDVSDPDNPWQIPHDQESQITDANGYFAVDCTLPWTEDIIFAGYIYARNADVRVENGTSWFIAGGVWEACDAYALGNGSDFDAEASHGAQTFVFRNVALSAIATRQRFGQSRPQVDVRLVYSGGNSSYSLSEDRINILHDHYNDDDSHVWGDWRQVFIHAHEYGHAYHHRALGGVPEYKCPEDGHELDGPHSMICGYFEGVANYIGALARPDLSNAEYPIRHSILSNLFYPGTRYYLGDGEVWDGSKIEGAVASFLARVGSPGFLGYGDAWVGEVIRTCRVWSGLTMQIARGIDHVIFCMEEQIDPDVTGSSIYFPERTSHPSQAWHDAGRPAGWSASAIRTRWTEDLYSDSPSSGGPGDGGGDDCELDNPEECKET